MSAPFAADREAVMTMDPRATTVFRDTLSITIADPDHSNSEDRFIDIGMSHRGQLLVVSYTEHKDRIRIISARPPTRAERKSYEETN